MKIFLFKYFLIRITYFDLKKLDLWYSFLYTYILEYTHNNFAIPFCSEQVLERHPQITHFNFSLSADAGNPL